jgi:acyl-CoA thioester hydrolase
MTRSRGSSQGISIELEVPFHDVDSLQVVWHGNYLKYLELARTALMRSRGLDVEQIVAAGFRQVVIEARCRYAFPLRYGERFRVDAWFKDVENRLNIGYEIFNLTQGRRTLHGHTILATTDIEGRLLLETPHVLLDRLR